MSDRLTATTTGDSVPFLLLSLSLLALEGDGPKERAPIEKKRVCTHEKVVRLCIFLERKKKNEKSNKYK